MNIKNLSMRGMVIIVFVISMSGLLPNTLVFASNGIDSTNVGGPIDTNTTWTLAGSPYIALTPVLVMEGITLTIEPGVVVKFNSHKALQIDGELHAVGTSGSPITFTSNSVTSNPGDWDYIVFTDTSVDAVYNINGDYESGSIIKYAVIEYAGGASVANNGALRIDAAAPFITFTVVHNNAASGIIAFNYPGILKMTHNTISENTGTGISVTSPVHVEITDSTITGNVNSLSSDGGGIRVDGWMPYGVPETTSVISRNVIQGNTQFYYGSGIYLSEGIATVSDNVISENSIADWCNPCWENSVLRVDNFCQVTIHNNLIKHNFTGGIWGGGMAPTIVENIIIDNQGIGMDIQLNGTGTITHNIIGDNTTGLDIGAFRLTQDNANISYNSFVRNTAQNNAALVYVGSDLGSTINANTIVGNINQAAPDNLRAVSIQGHPTFSGNNIYNNAGYALYNQNPQGSSSLNAENTWWGTSSSPAIQTLIYDWFDDSNKGIVDFSPYRTGINTDAPISPPIGFTVTPSVSMMGLSWTANPENDLAGYKVYWDTDSGYPYAHSADVGKVTGYNIPGLNMGTDYHIAVTAYDSSTDGTNDMTDGNESWFSIEKIGRLLPPPGAFNKTSPINGVSNQPLNPTLVWEPSTDASSYEYCYDTTNDNSCSGWTDNGNFTSRDLSGLNLNTTYYWHVRAINTTGTTYSNGSETAFHSFTTGDLPGAFKKSLPANGTTNQSTNPTLTWEMSAGATFYEYCYDMTNDNSCSGWTSNENHIDKTLIGLNPYTTYYWHVRAVNNMGTTYSNDSETAFWSFTTSPAKVTKTFYSTGTQDGWILESSETSNKGGTKNSTATLSYVGDGTQDKQYKSILSFDTSSLPENAVVTNIQLKINVQGFVGGNMFTPNKILGNLLVDICNPYFGSSAGLVVSDFQSNVGCKNSIGALGSVPGTGWRTVTLKSAAYDYINLAGTTQFRLRFQKDDNDDLGADYLKIYSGNAGAANRPQLIITYTTP